MYDEILTEKFLDRANFFDLYVFFRNANVDFVDNAFSLVLIQLLFLFVVVETYYDFDILVCDDFER